MGCRCGWEWERSNCGEDGRREARERQLELGDVCGTLWKPNPLETLRNL